MAEHSDGNPAAALRELLGQAVRRLDASSRTRHLYAVLTATYESTATQEAVARKLDLSYGTYRRYLSRAVDEVRETMWRWQVRAHIRAEQGARVPPRGAGGAAKSLAAESVARR
ncbi:hypothetical protein [Streptomyces sp. NRRL F-5650]|uniref:hypothetical protein n=1 Tax=Streptomyces sp. NRRL F-5650 TaxID=1463868 RepID=UPI001F48B639|nr:hypothetical protein [Streptomyces sp. NRRL F-5650]